MAMNNTINITDGCGGVSACPPPGHQFQVRVKYRDDQTPDSLWGPVTAEGATSLMVAFAAQATLVAQATLELAQ
jgi:hypothetical protein